jgi:hypothetical protein
MVLPGMKKKVSLQSFAMHKKVNWYMNKTIFYRSDFSRVDYDYENHFLQFQMTVDVGVKSGGEAKILLEIQTCIH